MPVIKKCLNCGKIYTVRPSMAETSKYCSRECKAESQKTGHDVVCDNCGKMFYRRQYHIDRQLNCDGKTFCSNDCKAEYKHKNSVDYRTCEICGSVFECSFGSTQRFCSPECRYEWNKTLVGINNPKFNQILITCDYCVEEFYRKSSQIDNAEHHFCSSLCRQKWFKEIYSQTDEYKRMRSIIAASSLKNNIPTTNTKPQIITNNILDDLSVNYDNEHDFVYYSVDNYLIDYNLIIEVMGDYWHSNPIVYTQLVKINEMQKKRINLDKSKHSFIKQYYGIDILYLWEFDLYNYVDLCKQLINLYINAHGVLSNYHSFNYEISNDDVVLKKDIIIPYQNLKIT